MRRRQTIAHLSKTRDALSSAPGWGADSDRVLWDDGVRQIIQALGTTLLPNASAKIG